MKIKTKSWIREIYIPRKFVHELHIMVSYWLPQILASRKSTNVTTQQTEKTSMIMHVFYLFWYML